jgi:predicted nucleotide-binding protein
MEPDRLIKDFERALSNTNYDLMTSCIKKYGKDFSVDLTDDAPNQESLQHLTDLFEETVTRLNEYVEINFSGFVSTDGKSTLVRMVQCLADCDRLEITSDPRDLMSVFLEFVSLYSGAESDKDTFERSLRLMRTHVASKNNDDDRENLSRNDGPAIWAEYIDDSTFLRHLSNTYGINHLEIRRLYETVKDIDLPIDMDNRAFCALERGPCTKHIPVRDSYFIAYPFQDDSIKDRIKEGFAETAFAGKLEPKIAQNVIQTRTLLCKVCEDILSSKFGVYVLNKHSLTRKKARFPKWPWFPSFRHLPNSNVTLELGMAIGNRKKWIILAESGTEIMSDLHGYLRIQYESVAEIPDRIRAQDFTGF